MLRIVFMIMQLLSVGFHTARDAWANRNLGGSHSKGNRVLLESSGLQR